MMRYFVLLLFIALFSFSCSKKEKVSVANQETLVHAPYDTVAVDSFSNGATSVDVARKIKMSSIAYQDSLKKILKTQQEEKKLKEELDKEKKKQVEEDKKKKAESRLEKPKDEIPTSSAQ